jgi:hypothetical protein
MTSPSMRHYSPERPAAGKNPEPGYNLILRPLGTFAFELTAFTAARS